jgi:general stress protein YciG
MINHNGDQRRSRNRSSQVTDAARKPRELAAMEPRLVSELARRGGKAAHRAGTAHQFTSDEARTRGARAAWRCMQKAVRAARN